MSPISDNVAISLELITCAEYQLFLDEKGEECKPKHWIEPRFPKGTAQQPVSGMRAYQADSFCEWLTEKKESENFIYRLPTRSEAEKLQEIAVWCFDGQNYFLFWQNLTNKNNIVKKLQKLSTLPMRFGGDLIQSYSNADIVKHIMGLFYKIDHPHQRFNIHNLINDSITEIIATVENRKNELKAVASRFNYIESQGLGDPDGHTIRMEARAESQSRKFNNYLTYAYDLRSKGSDIEMLSASIKALADDIRNVEPETAERIVSILNGIHGVIHASANDIAKNFAIELAHNIDFIFDYDSKFDRTINLNFDLSLINDFDKLENLLSLEWEEFCIMLNVTSWRQSMKFWQKRKKENFKLVYDILLAYYWDLTILKARKQGKLEAWEGICIVRERKE